jgi:translocation and assembly module TamB
MIIRRIGLALLSALVLVVLLIAGILGLAQTGFGKRMIAAQLSDLLSTPERMVELTGLQGTVPFDMRLGRVTAADPDGVWLEVDDVRLAWSPRALLRGRIWIDELSAARIAVDRLPPSEPEAEPEPLRIPELPDWLPAMTLEQFSVARLDLGQEMLGQSSSFALRGYLGTTQDGGSASLKLALERTDQPTGSVILDATLQLQPEVLDLALRAQESGGLLAAVTGEPAAGTFTLSLSGNGPLDGWKGDLEINAQGLARAKAAIGIALQDAPRLTLDGEVVPAPGLLPGDLVPIVGDRVGLGGTVAQTGPQEVSLERLQITTAAGELSGNAWADLDTENFRAEAELTAADLRTLSSLAGETLAGTVQLEITADGKLQQPQGAIRLQGDGLAFGAIKAQRLATSIDFAAHEPLRDGLRGLQLAGSGGLEGLDVADAMPLPLDRLDWQIDAFAREQDAVDLNLVRLSTSEIALEARGEVDPQTFAAAGQVDLSVGSLATLAAPFGQPVDGALRLRADVVAAEQAHRIDAQLHGTLDRLTGLPPGAAELLGSKVDLTTSAAIQPTSHLQITDLALEGAAATLGGALGLTLPDHRLDGAVSLNLPQLAVLQPLLDQKLSGVLEVDAVLAGSVVAPEVKLAAQTHELRLADLAIQKLALLADARGLPAEPAGKVELAVASSGIDASLATPYQLQGQTLRLPGLALRAPRSRIDGALTVDLERTLIDGTVRGRVQDLAWLRPVVAMPLQGEVDLDATLRPDNARQTVQLSLAVRDLVAGPGRVRRLEANATVTDALGNAKLQARASAQDARQDTLHLARAQVQASGTREQLGLRLTATGEAAEPFDLEARANVALAQAVRVRLEQLTGEVAGQQLRLTKAAEITVGDRELRLSELDLRLAGARLSADASLAGGQVAADATLQDLALATLAEFGAPDVIGQAGARLQMSGAVGAPRATLDLTVTDLRAADPTLDDLPPARLTAKAELAARRLRLDVRGEGVTDKPLVVTAELPLVLQLEPFLFQVPDGPVAGRLDAEIQLARFEAVAGLDDDRLEGLLDAGLNLGGTLHEPQLDGTVEIVDGIYENGLTGTVLHKLSLRARARQQRLTIEELSANDGGSGRITGQGFVEVDPAASFPFDVSLSLRSARLVQTNEADATLGGNLKLAGSARAASLTGQLEVEAADIRLPDQVGPSVPTIEVVEIGGDAQRVAIDGAGGGSAFDLRLAVIVNLPGRVFVRGRGLESEWQGRIEAQGTASEPRLIGRLEIRRGTFDLLDRRFDLRRGVITFIGQSPPNPEIDIEAVATTADITAIVRIGGDAKQPTFALESQPPLPQDEVLSRLMFNRAANSITPLQAVQLAAAVNRLRGGGPSVLDRLRNALGVDTLDIGGGGDGTTSNAGTTVRAGKYLSEGIYVEGETGTADQSSRARVEVEILPNVSLQAETGADANSGVGVKWKFDY